MGIMDLFHKSEGGVEQIVLETEDRGEQDTLSSKLTRRDFIKGFLASGATIYFLGQGYGGGDIALADPGDRWTEKELHLYPGWNLISICLDIAYTDLLSVLAPIEGHYSSVWTYETTLTSWKRYIPDGPPFLNDLYTIGSGKGYWINMIDEAMLTIIGEEITETAIPLFSGWNLVGYNSSTAQSLEHALSTMPAGVTSIWTYDNMARGTWLRYIVNAPDFLNTLTHLESGKGYWIHAEQDCVWDISP